MPESSSDSASCWQGRASRGGGLGSVLQLTAAVIVFGGTFGAVLVSFSLDEVSFAARRLQAVFVDESTDPARLVRRIVNLAAKARRNGITTIENELVKTDAPFLRKGLMLVGDGNDPQAVRELLEVEDNAIVERESVAALVYESAGGYAPTFGILGAVMGLIQVMEHLTDPGRLGAGIAVAFVATILWRGIRQPDLPTNCNEAAHAVPSRHTAPRVDSRGRARDPGGLEPQVRPSQTRGFPRRRD